MGQMSEADFERAQFAAQAEADKLRGRRARWHRFRQYLPGSAPDDKWGEPSAIVYHHNVHLCIGEMLCR